MTSSPGTGTTASSRSMSNDTTGTEVPKSNGSEKCDSSVVNDDSCDSTMHSGDRYGNIDIPEVAIKEELRGSDYCTGGMNREQSSYQQKDGHSSRNLFTHCKCFKTYLYFNKISYLFTCTGTIQMHYHLVLLKFLNAISNF